MAKPGAAENMSTENILTLHCLHYVYFYRSSSQTDQVSLYAEFLLTPRGPRSKCPCMLDLVTCPNNDRNLLGMKTGTCYNFEKLYFF